MSYFSGYCVQRLGVGDGITGIPIQWLAQLVLVCDCYVQTRQQYVRTCLTYRKLVDTILLRKNHFIHKKSLMYPRNSFLQKVLGASTDRWLQIQYIKGVRTTQRITQLSLRFIADLFSLSQYCILLIESFSWDEATQISSIRNFFLNSQTVLSELSENKVVLKKRLVELQPIFKSYLKMDITPIIKSTNATLDFADDLLEGQDDVLSLASNTAQIVGKASWAVGKRMLAASSLLVSNHVPGPLREDFHPLPHFGQIEESTFPVGLGGGKRFKVIPVQF